MWATFDNRPKPVFGQITLGSNNVVTVDGPEKFTESRERLLGLTPAGVRGLPKWSGNFSLGFNRQSGNKTQTSLMTSAELARRTPNTELVLEYLGSYGEANGEQVANNQRVNLGYDIRFGRDWFWRPMYFEYYEDPLANIGLQLTANTSLGYYIFDVSGLSWSVAAGPGYQYQRFNTVEAGQSDVSTTTVGTLDSKFKIDLTDRLDFSVNYRGLFGSEEAGGYTHHTVTKFSYEIKRHLTLDVSYVWDFLANPQVQSNGDKPQKNDSYLAIGLGVRF